MITNFKKSLLGIVEDNSTHNSSISGIFIVEIRIIHVNLPVFINLKDISGN